jgi:enoyl-CoA hydratase/carnithine racemase
MTKLENVCYAKAVVDSPQMSADMELAASADIRIAVDNSKIVFATPENKIIDLQFYRRLNSSLVRLIASSTASRLLLATCCSRHTGSVP